MSATRQSTKGRRKAASTSRKKKSQSFRLKHAKYTVRGVNVPKSAL